MHIDAALAVRPKSILRHSSWDAILVGLSAAHAAALVTVPSIPLVAIALWWNANTIAHNFIHTPFFRSRALNVCFSTFLSAVQGIPQTLWRHRHLAHHAGRDRAFRWTWTFAAELGVDRSRSGRPRSRPRATRSSARICPATPSASSSATCRGTSNTCAAGRSAITGGSTTSASSTTATTSSIICGRASTGRDLPQRLVEGAAQSSWPPVLRWLDDVPPAVLGGSSGQYCRRPCCSASCSPGTSRRSARCWPARRVPPA